MFVEKDLLDLLKKVVRNRGSIYNDFRSSKQRGVCFISPGEQETHLKVSIRKIIVARFPKYSQGEMKHALRWFEDLKWL